MLLKFKWPPLSIPQSCHMNMNSVEATIWFFLLYAWEDLMNYPNHCRFPTRNYWAKRSHCSVMRNIYTQTRWTFNAIWVPSRPGLVTEGVRGRTSRERSIRYTWHPVLTSARQPGWWQLISSGAEELLHKHHTHTGFLPFKKPKIQTQIVALNVSCERMLCPLPSASF